MNGKLVGSKIIGQSFATPVIGKNGKHKEEKDEVVTEADPRYFQSRPSATEGGAVQRGGQHILQPRPQQHEDRGSERRKHQGLSRTEHGADKQI